MINIEIISDEIGVPDLEALPRDVSPREYYRGVKDGRKFILMVYPQANETNRAEILGFVRIGQWLEAQGVKSAELIMLNEEKCYALFEDLGRVSFGKALKQQVDTPESLYSIATDVLCVLRDAACLDLPDYYKNGRVHANRRQFMDYYVPYMQATPVDEDKVQGFLSVWQSIEDSLPECPEGFVHGDYHLENLIYRPEEDGLMRCALIDYQDALYGPLPYDLLNLLEDARMSVPEAVKDAMKDKYCTNMNANERDVFLKWYRVLAAQFHGRVLGLFIKLAAEQGRDQYLVHIPRLQNYMVEALKDPLLKPLKEWLEKEGVDFTPQKDLHGDEIRKCFEKLQDIK